MLLIPPKGVDMLLVCDLYLCVSHSVQCNPDLTNFIKNFVWSSCFFGRYELMIVR
jgi:hypothetical protein